MRSRSILLLVPLVVLIAGRAAPVQDKAAPTAGLVGHWKLHDAKDGKAPDSSTSGNAGTLAGGPEVHSGSRSLAFDGKDDHVNVGEAAAFKMKDAFTIAAWIHPTGAGGDEGGIIVNREGEYEIGRDAEGRIRFALANDNPGWDWIDSGFTATLNKWTHVAWTYSSKDRVTRLYANGKEVFSVEAAGEIGDNYTEFNQLWIGGRQKEGGVEHFHGRIADVRIYNRALAAAEVEAARAADAAGRDK